MSNRAKKKNKSSSWLVFIITLSILLIGIIGLIIYAGIKNPKTNNSVGENEEFYVTIGNKKIDSTEYYFYYSLVYMSLINQNGDYLQGLGFDSSKNPASQIYRDDETWEEYFEDQTDFYLQRAYAFSDAAQKDKDFTYSGDAYNDFINKIEEYANKNNITFEEYCKNLFSVDITRELVEEYAYRYYLSYEYGLFLNESKDYSASSKEIDKYIKDNENEFLFISYNIFDCSMTREDGPYFWEVKLTPSGDIVCDKDETVLLKCGEFKIDDFQYCEGTQYIQTVDDSNGFNDSYSLLSKRISEDIIKKVENGMDFEEAAKYYFSDAEINTILYNKGKEYLDIFYPAISNEIYTKDVGEYFVGTSFDGKSSSVIIINKREVDNSPVDTFIKISQSYTEETKDEVLSSMQDLYDEYNKTDKTKNDFFKLYLNFYHSENNGLSSIDSNGEINEDDMNVALEWVIDESRKFGDVTLINDEENKIVYLLYFVEHDVEYSYYQADCVLYTKNQEDYMNSLTKGFDLYRSNKIVRETDQQINYNK